MQQHLDAGIPLPHDVHYSTRRADVPKHNPYHIYGDRTLQEFPMPSLSHQNSSLNIADIQGAQPKKLHGFYGKKRGGFYSPALAHIENLHCKDKYGFNP